MTRIVHQTFLSAEDIDLVFKDLFRRHGFKQCYSYLETGSNPAPGRAPKGNVVVGTLGAAVTVSGKPILPNADEAALCQALAAAGIPSFEAMAAAAARPRRI